MKFGYCPLPLRLSFGSGYSIHPIEALDSTVARIENCEAVRDGWMFRSLLSSSANAPAGRVFGLPVTHVLSTPSSSDRESARFLTWVLSFLVGMRLTMDEAGFLDSTPIKPRVLVDFFSDNKTIECGLERALGFYESCRSDPLPGRNTKRYEAAIHALLLAQNPMNLPFETFLYLYMALDACYSIMSCGYHVDGISHMKRIQWMCEQASIETPAWAVPENNRTERNKTAVAEVRNYTFHEAIYMGEPLGFAVSDSGAFSAGASTDPLLEMRALACRLLVFVLDRQASGSSQIDYVRSPIDTRCAHELSFP